MGYFIRICFRSLCLLPLVGGFSFAQAPADAQKLIERDISDKEKRLAEEKSKLQALYTERSKLSPQEAQKRLDAAAGEFVDKSFKAIADQAKAGPMGTPLDAVKGAKRGVDVLQKFKEVAEATNDSMAVDERQTSIEDDIKSQERAVKVAAQDLGVAKGAAHILGPMLDAMIEHEEQVRIEALRAKRIEHQRVRYPADKARADKPYRPLPPGPASFPPDSPPSRHPDPKMYPQAPATVSGQTSLGPKNSPPPPDEPAAKPSEPAPKRGDGARIYLD